MKFISAIFFSLIFLCPFARGQAGISGQVVDSISGQPLFSAVVILRSKGQIVDQELTSIDGYFSIHNIDTGIYLIEISYLGFENYVSELILTTSKSEVFLLVKLIDKIELLSPVIVEIPVRNIKETTCNDCINYQAIKYVVVRTYEVLPHYESIPEIISSRIAGIYSKDVGHDGQLYCFGSRPDATRYFIDQIEVIGDMKIPFKSISQIDVTCFGVPAKYGDATGGIVSITTKGFLYH